MIPNLSEGNFYNFQSELINLFCEKIRFECPKSNNKNPQLMNDCILCETVAVVKYETHFAISLLFICNKIEWKHLTAKKEAEPDFFYNLEIPM